MLQEFSGSRVWYWGDAGDVRFYICDICSCWEDFQALGCSTGGCGGCGGCVFSFLSYMFMLGGFPSSSVWYGGDAGDV